MAVWAAPFSKYRSRNLEEVSLDPFSNPAALKISQMKSVENPAEERIHRVMPRIRPLKLPGFEDVINDVHDAIGGDCVTLEDLRVVDEVVQTVERMKTQLISVVLLSREWRDSYGSTSHVAPVADQRTTRHSSGDVIFEEAL